MHVTVVLFCDIAFNAKAGTFVAAMQGIHGYVVEAAFGCVGRITYIA